MTDETDPKHLRLVKALDAVTPKKPPPAPRRQQPAIKIVGNGNVVGDGNTVYNAPPPRPRVRVESAPGTEHITEAQAAELKGLVADIVAESAQVKRTPTTHQRVWLALNAAMKVTTYKLIPFDMFEAAKSVLLKRRAITRAMPSAKRKVDGWRASAIGAIHARSREFDGGEARRKTYMLKQFRTDTMTECSDDQLEQLRKHVFGWKH